MKPASFITTADYLILESTYGDRLHDKINPEIRIAEIINSTIKQGGSVLIPAFAVGRAQTMLYYLYLLKKNKQIPDIPVYLDSPMAIDATEILLHNLDEHKLTQAECQNVCNTATYIRTPQESKAINNNRMPKIIISASGMMSGGRVLHHLKALAPDPRNTILITGFQAEGTRGASLLAGADSIKIHGEYIHVKAKVAELTNTSAHADYEEILIWLKHVKQAPKMVFITHGEPEAALALKQRIETELGWLCVIPRYQDSFLLS
jgi:metallo-beta-lactamase family protein